MRHRPYDTGMDNTNTTDNDPAYCAICGLVLDPEDVVELYTRPLMTLCVDCARRESRGIV